ncbi:uncharacterized protein B0P05DRAFT_465076 [Gilbertella persicaria]|uniref:uncharacterized protein n=1 Tax=Gilbertella persicaria TaxID=101096 RepID=UPI00221E72D5|nr:uncharacterized protein B0P05DRAFT_465076 [Gilbertella persicaria]KAI8088061.1 hypothetical protein B0P05DRAFT_465076 [Gilbertella persicaria]
MRTEINKTTSAEDIIKIYNTDLSGKVAIVTGANSGIGLETARVLALAGAKVIVPCRTLEKATQAISNIQKNVPHSVDLVPMQIDLSDLATIKTFVDQFLQLNLPLNLLINNAGVMGCPKTMTKDGFEIQFGVNHLGHFYLTTLLLDKLKASESSRVVVLSSSGNRQFCSPEGIDFDNLNGEKIYRPCLAYGQSKLCNILFAKELQRRLDAEGADVIVTSVHPGAVKSNLGRHFGLSGIWDFVRSTSDVGSMVRELVVWKYESVGASTSIYCAVSPDVIKGEFYADNEVNRTYLNDSADNADMAKQLWKVSEHMVQQVMK